jgi:acyl-coenzyme A thioesterase PaaI-like protein
VGERLVARASAEAVSKTQAVCRCEVFAVKDGAEKLCALAQGTIVRLAQD